MIQTGASTSRRIHMNNIETRAPFFPNSKNAKSARSNSRPELKRNTLEQFEKIQRNTAKDAKVDINSAVKDFSRIKKAVDAAPPINNDNKIAMLKEQINSGNYKVDYDAVAEKMLTQEY